MKRQIKIMDTDIRCCDDIQICSEYISVNYESTLDVRQYFGILLKPQEYLQFETKWYPDGRLIGEYALLADTPSDPETILDIQDWELTEEEIAFFKEKMEAYCKEQNQCSIAELFQLYHTQTIPR